jgi:hypothetical protein
MVVFIRASAHAFAKVHDAGNARALGPAIENLRRLFAFQRGLVIFAICFMGLALFGTALLAVLAAHRAG